MLIDTHSTKISLPITAVAGTTAIIAGDPNRWIYIHELIGDLTAGGTLDVMCGAVNKGHFIMDEGQGITEQDEPGNDGVARFVCKPGEAFSLIVTGGTFNGSIDYSFRY